MKLFRFYLLPLAALFAFNSTGHTIGKGEETRVLQILSVWPETPRNVAHKMIDKYGLPNEATESVLTWHNNGVWKRTLLFRDEVPHSFPKPHTDLLQQFVNYRVPPETFTALAIYDGSVVAERTNGELSARCDKEEMNFLALNLSHDIIIGKKTVQEARDFYAATVKAFMDGDKHPYKQKLLFPANLMNTRDPDQTMLNNN